MGSTERTEQRAGGGEPEVEQVLAEADARFSEQQIAEWAGLDLPAAPFCRPR